MQAVLFDIDGTLMKAGGAGREALSQGAGAVLGVSVDTARAAAMAIDFRGRTDELLIEELLTRLGHPPSGLDGRIVAAYLERLPFTLNAAPVEILRGAPELVGLLEQRPETVVGLLTGNIRSAARIKLGVCGLGHLADRPGGFAEDGRERSALAIAAAQRLAALGIEAHQALVIGDTEHDITAARVIGARAVGVATGWTKAQVLERAQPDLLLSDLADPKPILDFLDAMRQ